MISHLLFLIGRRQLSQLLLLASLLLEAGLVVPVVDDGAVQLTRRLLANGLTLLKFIRKRRFNFWLIQFQFSILARTHNQNLRQETSG